MKTAKTQLEQGHEYQEKRKWRKEAHHFRPRSRGGDDSRENEGWFGPDHVRIHCAFHALFSNLEPHEVVCLILYAPRFVYNLKTRHPQYWNTVFGKANPPESVDIMRFRFGGPFDSAIDRILKNHWYTGEVPLTWEEAIRDSPHGGDFSSDGLGSFSLDDDWITLFDHIGVYGVATLLLYSWITVCPHKEVKLPHTSEMRLDKRIKSWNRVFGTLCDQERAIQILRNIVSNRHKEAILHAVRLHRMIQKNFRERRNET